MVKKEAPSSHTSGQHLLLNVTILTKSGEKWKLWQSS